MSFFSPSRCVLLLGDEGLTIYDMGATRDKLLDTISWKSEHLEQEVSDLISKRCKGKSVLLINDMVEQHYRKERIPKVSPFDQANVIKRRLTAAFPTYPIRSALKLKEKAPPKDGQSGGHLYLFAALPLSENIKRTLGAVQRSYASISGFCLLPVESSIMVQTLSKKLAKITERASVWTLFVGQHHSGGLRQIVTKNGELALTRMTPIVDSDVDHNLWASELANEVKGTIGYLSRFGFNLSDGLDVIVIANNALADTIEDNIDFECNLNVLTSVEAAKLLGLKLGRQDDARYADPLHAAWIANKTSMTMPLQAAQVDNISQPAKMASAVSLLLFLACAYFGYQCSTQVLDWMKNNEDLVFAEKALAAAKVEYEAEVERKKTIGADVLLVENSTKTYQNLDRAAMRPLRVFDLIGKSLGNDIHLTGLEVRPAESSNAAAADPSQPPPSLPPDAEQKPKDYEVTLIVRFPSVLAPEKGVQLVNEFEKRLKTNLPDHAVSVRKQVADLTYTGTFQGEATSKEKTDEKKEDYEARLVIKGGLQ